MQSSTLRLVAAVAAVLVSLAGAGCNGSSGSSGSSSASTATLSVTMSPSVGTTLPDASISSVYSQTFTVLSGGKAPYTLSPTGIPAGLSWTSTSTTGTLTGSPTGPTGTGTFEIQVTDSTGLSALVDYTVSIDAAGGVLTFTPTSLANGTLNAPYSANLAVIGGTAPFDFTSTGSLPLGLTLGPSASGVNGQATISGTPAAQGTYSFTIKVSDAASPAHTGSQPYSITIQ
jgi:hypothetical protein